MGEYLIGTQSWKYQGWVGAFYPPGTRPDEMLSFYGRVFRTLEVDSTFYGIPAAPVVEGWRDAVPDGFRFALKVPQQVTHERRLVDAGEILDRFLGRAVLLKKALGPLLVQLAPDFLPTVENKAALREFIAELPTGFGWAVEFRHRGWFEPDVLDVLAEQGVTLVLPDSRWVRRERVLELAEQPTGTFGYVRWMGGGRRFADYSTVHHDRSEEKRQWAESLVTLGARVDWVHGFFNNQYEGHAPHSVRTMQNSLGLPFVEPVELHPQGELFAR